MRRAERLFRLVNEVRTRGVVKSCELAESLEVSVSTIYRDIAHLQASGLPIEGAAGIGYIMRPGFDLPNVTFTHDQIDALAIGLAFVERAGDPALAMAAREARAKLQAGLPKPEERRLADAPFFSLQPTSDDLMAGIALLRRAIRKREIVRFGYRNSDGNSSERRVWPLVVWNLADGWMFSGWCELREDFRTFRLDRTADLASTDENFEDNAARNLDAFLAQDACQQHAAPSSNIARDTTDPSEQPAESAQVK